MAVYVVFLVDKVTIGQTLINALRSCSINITPPYIKGCPMYVYYITLCSITGSGQLWQRVLAVKSTTDKHQQNSLGVPNGPRRLTKPKTGL
jgi:hypothetical protein